MGNSGSSSLLPGGGCEAGIRKTVTAVAVTAALIAWGAYNFATSSRSEHCEDSDRHRDVGVAGESGGAEEYSRGRVGSGSGPGVGGGGGGLVVDDEPVTNLQSVPVSRSGIDAERIDLQVQEATLSALWDYYPRHLDQGDYQNSASRTLTFMTYNVWMQEKINLHGRIGAISRLVEKHSPDVIFFQEITPNIYRIFQTFGWWDKYNCSNSPKKAIEGNICIVLSKLPIETGRYQSSKGGKLSTCKLDVGIRRRLFVANGHLKCPNPPEMNTKIRKTRAKKALKFLNCSSNIVFGGDMNWDEGVDGPFPLPKNWVDVWASLKPNEDGWTYDTKSNQLLKRRRPLQKRLDRFVCKLRDFRLIDIKLIGMGRKPPSDHYGLLLTICYN